MDENKAMIVEISEVPEISVPNYEELVQRLSDEIETYRGYEVTEDNVPEAKKVKASLNNLTKQIEDERKRVKKVYEAPLKEFESKAKRLSGMVKEVSDEIKEQLDRYEKKRLAKKYAWCVDKWFELGGETAKTVDYTLIHKPSWLNQSTPIGKIEEEMTSVLRQIRQNIEMLTARKVDDRVLGTYIRTLDVSEALAEKDKAVQEQKAVQEIKPTGVKFIPMNEDKVEEGKEVPEAYRRRQNITFRVNVDYIGFQVLSKILEDGNYNAELLEGDISVWQ